MVKNGSKNNNLMDMSHELKMRIRISPARQVYINMWTLGIDDLAFQYLHISS